MARDQKISTEVDRQAPNSVDPADNAFLQAIESIYDAAPDPSRWPDALQKIADVFDDVGAIMMWRRDDGGFGTIASPSLSAAQEDYVQNQWYLRDLPAERVIEKGLWLRSDSFTDSDGVHVSEQDVATHPFYTEFSARHGIRWRVAAGIAPDPHVAVWIAVQRALDKEAYSQVDLMTMTKLGRHAEKALRLSIRLLDAELANLGLRDALARVGIGVFALDALGRVVHTNPAGERLSGPYLQIADGRLRMGSGEERAAIDAAIDQMLRGRPEDIVDEPRPILVQRSAPDRPLVVYLLPITPRESPAEQFLTHSRCIVLVVDPQASDPVDPSVVRDVLGLTLGEARVAALVATGLSPRDAAKHLGIMEGTARTVLKRVYGKVGVSRQSELTALLARAVLPAHTI